MTDRLNRSLNHIAECNIFSAARERSRADERRGIIIDNSISTTVGGDLLQSVLAIAEDSSELGERRRALVNVLAELVHADAGWWAWGRGWPNPDSITPVAIVDFGLTDEQRAILIEWGLDRDGAQIFRQRIRAQMGDSRQVASLRPQVFSDEEWAAVPAMRRQLERGGWKSWLHCVRYSARDTWSNLFLLRNSDQPEFSLSEAALIDFAMTNVKWLHATTQESLPPEAFVGLTPRQHTVMLMLLDGLARKAIAHQLGIAEHTVGDHIKAIFRHFKVGTTTELAALFLRGR